MNNDQEQAFINNAKTALDSSTEQLSPEIKDKLYQARRAALNPPTAEQKSIWAQTFQKPWSLALASVVLVVAVLLPNHFKEQSHPEFEQLTIETLELLGSEEELELYEDLDFIVWLAEQNSQG